MSKKQNSWFRLDNAGKLYPSIATSRVSTVYRITAVLKITVEPKLLQEALNATAKNFPLFNVKLRRGVFWFYFEHTDEVPTVHKDRYFPCTTTSIKGSQPMPYKVMYYNNRIHLEMSHAIADGGGGLAFLKDLISNYYDVMRNVEPTLNPVPDSASEDAFQKYFQKRIPNPPKVEKAYHFPFKLIEKGEYRVTDGILYADELKALSKKYGTTQTKILLCLYFEAIQEYIEENRIKVNKPVIINTPVNLRSLFPSETLRNFFISITPGIDLRLGHYTRDELLGYLDHYFALCLNEKFLKRYIARNIRNEMFWHVRLIPLVLKNLIIPIVYNYYGESSYTSSISNLGPIKISEPYGEIIERLAVLPPPSEGNIIKGVVANYGNLTTITFGSLTDNHIIEKKFFEKLRKEGLRIKIETNYSK